MALTARFVSRISEDNLEKKDGLAIASRSSQSQPMTFMTEPCLGHEAKVEDADAAVRRPQQVARVRVCAKKTYLISVFNTNIHVYIYIYIYTYIMIFCIFISHVKTR